MDGCRVGVARVDITPEAGGWPAGWSQVGRKVGPQVPEDAPLVATLVVLEDARGERAVFVHADLHCGGAALWRRICREAQIPEERLILAGTHTHQGPGHLYGNTLFDTMTTPSAMPVGPWRAARLGRRLGKAVREALEDLQPGGVALGEIDVNGIASNRALPSFLRNPEVERQRFAAEGPGRGCSDEAHPCDRARDPRLRVLVFGTPQAPRAVLAWAAVHGTAHGPAWPRWSADWAGEARRRAEAVLGVRVGFAGGASGDISPLACDEAGQRRGEGPRADQGSALVEHVGARLAEGLCALVPRLTPEPFELRCAHRRWHPPDDPALDAARYGLATLGGGVDGVNPDHWEDVRDGVDAPAYTRARPFPDGHPHHPKADARHALPLGLPLGPVVGALAPGNLPVHLVDLGLAVVVTVPGEPTTMCAWRLEQAVSDAAGGRPVIVCGYAGDFAGYWTTAEEYDQQRYEGASTMFGRLASERLRAVLVGMMG